jgi:hypothetical protein
MFAKKMLSLEEIECQTILALPARELMTLNTFTNGADAGADNSCSATSGGVGAILNIAATVGCVQSAVANSFAGQSVS